MAILFAVLAFVCPVGVYCFFLASINQRSRPLMVNGRWDAVGLLFAASGFALITVPKLASDLLAQYYVEIVSMLPFDPAWLMWAVYYSALVGGSWLMTMRRANATMIYQVDPAMFNKVLEATLTSMGLLATRERDHLILTRAPTAAESTGITTVPGPPAVAAERLGVMAVDTFPAMCHVTLRWEQCPADRRRAIETELDRGLTLAAPDENPAAGWFLTVSGLIFGALTMVAMTFIFLILLGKR